MVGATIVAATAKPPKKLGQRWAHGFRLELQHKDSDGRVKYGLAFQTKAEKLRWESAISEVSKPPDVLKTDAKGRWQGTANTTLAASKAMSAFSRGRVATGADEDGDI